MVVDTPTPLQEFVEAAGISLERLGAPKMAGRILGYLLAADAPHISFDDLCQALGASKSSISTSLRLLADSQMVSPYTLPGIRKTFYRFHFQEFYTAFEEKMNHSAAFRRLFEQALALYGTRDDDRSRNLAEMVDFYRWLEAELPRLFQQWRTRKSPTQ